MTSAPRPNRRLEEAGWMLHTTLAVAATSAATHIARELHQLDGHRGGAPEVSVSGNNNELTPVEAVADQRFRLSTALVDLNLQIDALLVNIRDLADITNDIMRMRVPRNIRQPETVKLCRDALAGRDGNIEWGDPTCLRTADKSGLCQAHYMAWYRWRNEHGVDTSRDFQPADTQRAS